MYISPGYSFRNMIGTIKSETEFATMVLSPKTVEISFTNNSNCAAHKIVIQTSELIGYKYNIRDEQGCLYQQFNIPFETAEMFNTTKSIGRKDGVRLYWLEGDSKINVQPVKTTTRDPGRAGALFVKIHNIEYVRYDISSRFDQEPNIRVHAKEFADICSQAITSKCSSLEITGRNKSFDIKGVLPNNTEAFVNKFVSQTEVDTTPQPNSNHRSLGLTLNIINSDDIVTVNIPIATVKALSKIHNISPDGTLLRFYFCDKAIKIESALGTYGVYTICLRHYRP